MLKRRMLVTPAEAWWVSPRSTLEFAGSVNSAMSVYPFFRRGDGYFVRLGVKMYGAVVDLDVALLIEPGDGVFHPGFVVAIREVLAGVGAAAFLAVVGAVHGDYGLAQKVVEFEGFDEVAVPN